MANPSINAGAVVQRLEDQRHNAVLDGDADAFEGLCHPELVYTHSDGSTDSLIAYTGKLRTGAVRYHRIDHQNERITVIGHTALVKIRMNADLTVNGIPMTMKNSALAVWVNEAGSWKLAAYQATPDLHVGQRAAASR